MGSKLALVALVFTLGTTVFAKTASAEEPCRPTSRVLHRHDYRRAGRWEHERRLAEARRAARFGHRGSRW
jgi:hypothetical protein